MSSNNEAIQKVQRALSKSILDCQNSANDFRNTPDVRQIFQVVSIILTELSDSLSEELD
jgi:hypothetical protein